MVVARLVAHQTSDGPAKAAADLGWICTLAGGTTRQPIQLNLAREDGAGPKRPAVSQQVDHLEPLPDRATRLSA
ncbi:MAG: hypothetical protein MRY77_15350 [Rhodobacteraceae bacterium]|nr:hypothetical protein [Paracoccaceae bacterium]